MGGLGLKEVRCGWQLSVKLRAGKWLGKRVVCFLHSFSDCRRCKAVVFYVCAHRGDSRFSMQNRSKKPTRRGYSSGPRPAPSQSAESDDEKAIEVEGTVSAVLAGTMFRVRLASGLEVLAHISGKMRKRFIRLVVGDKVKMEMSPYDVSKARIVYRIG